MDVPKSIAEAFEELFPEKSKEKGKAIMLIWKFMEHLKDNDLPMGISNWISHGKKYQYDKYLYTHEEFIKGYKKWKKTQIIKTCICGKCDINDGRVEKAFKKAVERGEV